MNLLLFQPGERDAAGRVVVDGRRARHLVDVLGVEPGRTLRVGEVRGPTGTATVEEVRAGAVVLHVTLEPAAPTPPAVSLVLAVPRPKALRRVLEAAASMGVRAVDLVNAWRVDRSYWSSPVLAPEAMAEAALVGCEQGGHTWVPEVRVHRFLMPFLEGLPPAGAAPGEVRLLAHPRDARLIEAVARGPGDRLVAIGPEGGWIDAELGSLEGCGFQRVTLGPFVLRVESAVPALLAQLSLLQRS